MPSLLYETVVERVKHILQREQLAIYVYEIRYVENLLQRRLGLNFGVPDRHWLVFYDAIRDLVRQEILVAYRDPIEDCLAVVAKSRWEKDVAADPEMEDLRVKDLPETGVVMSMLRPPRENGRGFGR